MNQKILKRQITATGHLSCKGKFKLSNGSVIHFSIDKRNGIQQWGAPTEDLWVTMPVLDRYWNEMMESI